MLTQVLQNKELGSVEFTVVRQSSQINNKGRLVAGERKEILCTGLIQPLPGKEVELLPEGERGKETIVIFTEFALQPQARQGQHNEDMMGDLVLHQSKTYRVLLQEEWQAFGSKHFKGIAVLEG